MYIAVQHSITDPAKWQHAFKVFFPKLPPGLKLHSYAPSLDGRQANCLWEADTVDAVKSYVEEKLGHCSQNTYFEVEYPSSWGLPR